MDSALIAGIVAIMLGAVVVVVGLRRNLSDVTRGWLPRFDEASENVMGSFEEVERRRPRRHLSPRERKLALGAYVAFGLFNATVAIFSSDSRLEHVIFAVLCGVAAVMFALKKLPST